jgi:3-hydroxybutyryl-CoA dehydrogenase
VINRIGVVGAGTMGVGVSHLFAAGGHRVALVDSSTEALDHARRRIVDDLRMVAMFAPDRGQPSEDVLGRITMTTAVDELKEVDFVVENVTEKMDVKRSVYEQIDGVCPEHCIFGVNTSAIPITRIAGLTGRRDRVIGTHFMNPAHIKPMVELIRGFHTSQETIAATQDLLTGIGKESVVVEDSPGFVTNRVAMLTVNEAVLLLEENVATAAEIDRLFVRCFGHRMGPLATADLIGLDTVLYSLDVLLENFSDPKYRPALLLRKYVDAGLLGRKSGRGFFSYETDAS